MKYRKRLVDRREPIGQGDMGKKKVNLERRLLPGAIEKQDDAEVTI